MTKKTFPILLGLLFLHLQTGAQNATADSLRAAINAATSLSQKVELHLALAEEILGHSIDESLAAVETAEEFARELGDEELTGRCLTWKGRALGEKSDYENALRSFDEAEAIFNNAQDSFYLAKIYNGKGIIFKYQNKLEKAIEYQYKSALISEAMGMPQNAATTYNSIANIHTSLNDEAKAVGFYEKSIAILEQGENTRALCGTLINLAHIIRDQPKRKLQIYDRVEQLATENQYHRILAYLYSGRADFYEKTQPNTDSQKVHYRLAIDHAKLAGDPYMEAFNGLYLGILEAAENPVEAERRIVRSLQNEYIQQSELLRAEGNFHLSKSLFEQGKFEAAYLKIDTALGSYRAVYDEETATMTAEATAKYEASKKEAQIVEQQLELARQKNRQNKLAIGGLVLLVLLAGVFQYFFYKQKQRKQAVDLALKTELAEAERLRQVDEMKSRFFTNVSHELRTPLTLIISPLEEALKKLKQAPLEADLKLAHRNSQQLLGLVNEVLDLAKMEAGKMEVQQTEVELLPLLRRVFFSFQSSADLKGVALGFSSELPAAFSINTDVPKLEKILNNLISNALKFTPKGGVVQFSVRNPQPTVSAQESANNWLELIVSDTGTGIHPEDLPHVFDRFFQSKKNTTGASGTGIGLALANQLAGLLGGKLTAESELLGKGSRFALHLPVSSRQPTTFSRESAVGGSPPATNNPQPTTIGHLRPRLLIVEDNPEMGEYLKKSLSKNYDCSVVLDGAEALRFLEKSPLPDLITSDVMMPNMDGFSLREKINEQLEWRQIPFILLTARTLEADKLKGFQLGIDDYVTKPFSLPELEARVRNLLTNKQLREATAAEFPKGEKLTPDEQLLHDAEKLVRGNLDDPDFSVEKMARELGFSQRHLSRVFGKLAGLTPVKFILELRLQKARQLLESQQFATVAEVRYETGIESASYFTRKFTERFGKNPKEYLQEK